MRPCSPSPQTAWKGHLHHFLRDMVTLAQSQDQDSHHISNFICFGALFLLLFKCKNKQKTNKNTHFVTTCFEKCVQMLLTIATSLGPQRRLLRAARAPGQWVGLGGSWLKSSEKDAISRCGFPRCLWKCPFVSGCVMCHFLLALRCSSEHWRRKAVSRKMALENVDPGYRGGLRGFRTEERNPELNLSPVLSQAEAEAVGLSRPPGGLGWARAS